jgi:hypothetical protein
LLFRFVFNRVLLFRWLFYWFNHFFNNFSNRLILRLIHWFNSWLYHISLLLFFSRHLFNILLVAIFLLLFHYWFNIAICTIQLHTWLLNIAIHLWNHHFLFLIYVLNPVFQISFQLSIPSFDFHYLIILHKWFICLCIHIILYINTRLSNHFSFFIT